MTKTGQDHLDSLRDGRSVYLDGQLVGDVVDHAAYRNAKKHPDKQNARIEHDKALGRVVTALLKDDTELFKQFMDNESFRRWLTDTVFALTTEDPAPLGPPGGPSSIA